MNKSYEVCSSYPEHTIVPSSISDQMLTSASKYRHKGRFPVLSYLHDKIPLARATVPVQPRPRRCVEVVSSLQHRIAFITFIRMRS